MDAIRQLKFGFIFLLLVLTVGTLGYMIIEGWKPLSALYMTVITITTVGYGEVAPLSLGGITFTIILILTSVGMVTFIVVGLARVMVEGEVRKILGRRKLEKRIAHLSGHYIVCGYGRIGSYICKELAEKPLPFVVVEKHPDITQRLEEAGYFYVNGDATNDETLRKAGIESAKCLVAVVASDADNLYITLTARELNTDLYILSRATDENAQKKLPKSSRILENFQSGDSSGSDQHMSLKVGERVFSRLLHPQHSDGIWIGLDQCRVPLVPLNEFPEAWC